LRDNLREFDTQRPAGWSSVPRKEGGKVLDLTQVSSLTPEEIIDLNRRYVFFSWSVQKAVQPIPVTGGEGIITGTPPVGALWTSQPS
jgi:hypothetical protein